MTIYDYKCDACRARFEVDHPMSAPPVKECPECGKAKVRKVLTTGGISVRGGGSQPSPMPAAAPCASGGCSMPGGMCGIG